MSLVQSPSDRLRPSSSRAARHGSPVVDSGFLGRVGEISGVAEALDSSRLVTLIGAPGIGKTRLALKVAEAYGEPAAMVELAAIAEPKRIPAALTSALSVREAPGRSLTDTLIAHLAGRCLLLVLDDCEHVLAACAELVQAVLTGCPEVRVLATSREPLGISAELIWQVPPLSLPPVSQSEVAELLESEAVRLFVERAAAVEPGFALNSYVAPAVGEICRRLDGTPLAIELAAARSELLSPPEIARRLGDRFDLLTAQLAGRRHAAPALVRPRLTDQANGELEYLVSGQDAQEGHEPGSSSRQGSTTTSRAFTTPDAGTASSACAPRLNTNSLTTTTTSTTTTKPPDSRTPTPQQPGQIKASVELGPAQAR